MVHVKITLGLSLLVLCASLFFSQSNAFRRPGHHQHKPQLTRDVPKFALLVGINKYKASRELRTLFGSENDVDSISSVLVQAFNFDPQNIRILKGEGAGEERLATASNIRDGFKWLIANAAEVKKAGKEAVIVFYFSGHGAQVANQTDDANDELDDGKDETIVPYDSRQGTIYDLRDDELDDYYAELSLSTRNVTSILDSCHAGTASRGDESVIARLAPDDRRLQPNYQRRFQPGERERRGRLVMLSAATSYQRAYERDKRRPDEPHHGTFTYYLVQALNRAPRATTYRELMQEVSVGVKSEIPSGQDPQAEGDVDSYVFGGTANRAEPFITLSDVNLEKGEVTFNAGKIHGVKPGSMIAIYTKTATSHGPDDFLINAVVKEDGISLGTALAVLPTVVTPDEAGKIKQIGKLAKVILLSPNFGGGPLRIDLSEVVIVKDRATRASLKDEIEKTLNDVKLIESGLVKIANGYDTKSTAENDSPVLTLKREKFGYVFPRADMLPPLRDEEYCAPPPLPGPADDIFYLDDGTGRALFGYYLRPDELNADQLVRIIDLYARQRNLLALSNKSSTLDRNVQVSLNHIPGQFAKTCDKGELKRSYSEDLKQQPQVLFDSATQLPRVRMELGLNQVFDLKLKNVSKQNAYVTVLLVGADGAIDIVYPEGGNAEASLLKANNTGSIARRVTTTPLGAEKYIVFITKRPQNFSFLTARGVSRSKGGTSMLERLLTRSGIISSRGRETTDSPDQWATIKFELVVAERSTLESLPEPGLIRNYK